MGKIKDLTGKTFHYLKVISPAGRVNGRHSWNCVCKCGKTSIVQTTCLNSGHSKSCGCLRIEIGASVGRLKKHGLSHTKEYRAWCGILSRCYSPTADSYKYYGAIGIVVCDRWKYSFENFLADMGEAPSVGHSIDRIETDKGYEPSNCRWVTVDVQANNKSSNILLEFRGEKKTLGQWCNHLNLNYFMVYKRIQLKWSPERALSTPSRKAISL